MKKPRFTKCVFFRFLAFKSHRVLFLRGPGGHVGAKTKKNKKKTKKKQKKQRLGDYMRPDISLKSLVFLVFLVFFVFFVFF